MSRFFFPRLLSGIILPKNGDKRILKNGKLRLQATSREKMYCGLFYTDSAVYSFTSSILIFKLFSVSNSGYPFMFFELPA